MPATEYLESIQAERKRKDQGCSGCISSISALIAGLGGNAHCWKAVNQAHSRHLSDACLYDCSRASSSSLQLSSPGTSQICMTAPQHRNQHQRMHRINERRGCDQQEVHVFETLAQARAAEVAKLAPLTLPECVRTTTLTSGRASKPSSVSMISPIISLERQLRVLSSCTTHRSCEALRTRFKDIRFPQCKRFLAPSASTCSGHWHTPHAMLQSTSGLGSEIFSFIL